MALAFVRATTLVRHETQSLRRDCLSWVSQNYLRDETLRAANARLGAAQTGIPLARAWGGGEVASADGLRFVVPVPGGTEIMLCVEGTASTGTAGTT